MLLRAWLVICALLFSGYPLADNDDIAPEAATGYKANPLVRAKTSMVVSANPYASRAGLAILADGGSAVDAMIAVQAVLTLVEPQSSGIGGGAFLVHWHAEQQQLTTLDGRENAPLAAGPDLFLNEHGQPLSFFDAVVGGRSVGTPGTVRLLWEAHQRFGTLPWRQLFMPAIELALRGFEVSPRLSRLIEGDREYLSRDPEARAYFFHDDGRPLQPGEQKTNPALAAILTRISIEGPSAFYRGDTPRAIVDKVRNAARPGTLALADFANYRVKERPAVCAPYRQYQICGMGPPSSGAVTLGQILGILSHFELATLGPTTPESWRLIADASRLAFADRGLYLADSDFVPVPVAGLLDPEYLAGRARLLKLTDTALTDVQPGLPPPLDRRPSPDQSIEFPSTSHISIRDAAGNALSMTSTIESGFGSRLMVQGFLLNNELTDFSFVPEQDGRPVANRVAPGKRPRSSMAPTIVLYNNQPLLIIGSPGGSRIIGYVLQSLINVLDWGMDIQEAIHQPHILHRGGSLEIEQGSLGQALLPAMKQLGFDTQLTELNSGTHAIMITPAGLTASADPRREGVALGQ
ncbi:gamma-glutamyltransferase [Zobellella maritima]|uniref:gamma-glutamyltransferase n=1 Tax=Zobellella maritima TaxID=2059725 RepID=UPI000E300C2F|nr:gamma-glutamyltransferase [Zobellella maritima]